MSSRNGAHMQTPAGAASTSEALRGLRGPPQMLPLLTVLGQTAEHVASLSSTRNEEGDSESAPDPFAFLCDALVHGGTGSDTRAVRGKERQESDGTYASEGTTDSEEEQRLKQQVKLPFPLPFLSPASPPRTATTTTTTNALPDMETVSTLCRDRRLVRHFVIPLLDRWQRGERKRLQDGQSAASRQAFLKADEIVRAQSKEAMATLREAALVGLMSPVLCPTGSETEEEVAEAATLLGRLAEVTGSFRVLCHGAVLLFLQQARLVLTELRKATTTEGVAAARVAAATHAAALVSAWQQFFARHGGTVLYDPELQEQLRTAETQASSASSKPSLQMAATMDEVQWAFTASLLAYVRATLTHGDGTAPCLRVDILEGFVIQVQTLLQRCASLQLSTSIGTRFPHLAATLAARNTPLVRQPLWDWVTAEVTAQESGNADVNAKDKEAGAPSALLHEDGTLAWGAVAQLLGRLTATQPAAEEAAASSVISAGERGYGLGSSGFYLGSSSSGVLGAMTRLVASCEEAVLETADLKISTVPAPSQRGVKRPRLSTTRPSPKAQLMEYLAMTFYAVYHPSCFTLLRSGGERLLPQCLKGLYALLCAPPLPTPPASPPRALPAELASPLDNARAESVEGWTSSSSSDDDEKDEHNKKPNGTAATKPNEGEQPQNGNTRPTLATEASQNTTTHHAALHRRWQTYRQLRQRLRGDTRLVMLLVHALLVMLERRGKVGSEDSTALTAWLLPSLLTLGSTTDPRQPGTAGLGANELFLPPPSVPPAAVDEAVTVWSPEQQSTFCLLTLITSGMLLALPWSIAGLYLCLRRWHEMSRQLRERYLLGGPAAVAACLEELRAWVDEGGGGTARAPGKPSTLACGAADEIVELTDTFYQQLTSGTSTGPGGVLASGDALLEERLRAVTPLRLPSPCGLVLVVSMQRTLSRQLYCLRNAYEEQRVLAEEAEGGYEYFSRSDTFCTTDDIRAFRTLVHTTHRMVFGFQAQPLALLRLWLGHLRHLFLTLVPPAADDDAVRLMPSSWQQHTTMDCFGNNVTRKGWRAAVKTPGTRYSAQTELRVGLGEALADLVLLPMADTRALAECPVAFPLVPQSAEWHQCQAEWHQCQAQWAEEMTQVQAVLPIAVLEALCFFLAIDTHSAVPPSRAEAPGSPTVHTSPTAASTSSFSEIEDDAFLGLHGLVALCVQLERGLVPGSVRHPRVAHLIRCLWAAADAAALGR